MLTYITNIVLTIVNLAIIGAAVFMYRKRDKNSPNHYRYQGWQDCLTSLVVSKQLSIETANLIIEMVPPEHRTTEWPVPRWRAKAKS